MIDLQHKDAIGALVLQYAKHIRDGAGERCARLFTDAAEYEICDVDPVGGVPVLRSRNIGRDVIIGHIARPRPGMRVCPLISNLLIEVDGAAATSSAMMRSCLPVWDRDNRRVSGFFRI